MAKTGTILATLGSSTLIKETVAQAEPRVSNLGSVVADALAANTAKSFVLVNTLGRTVQVYDTADAADAVETFTDLDADKMTPTESGKRTVAFEVTAIDAGPLKTALDDIVAPRTPTFSIASLVSAIEDAAAAAGKSVIIAINQETAEVTVYQGSDAEIGAAYPPGSIADIVAGFSQTVESSSGPKDAFE